MYLNITPTALKGWFQYRCERRFIYETKRSENGERIQVEEQDITSAWSAEGNDYERVVVDELGAKNDDQVLRPGPKDDGCLTESASRRFLARDESARFAHQVLLRSTPALRKRLRLTEDLRIGRGMVDLLEVVDESPSQPPNFRVIDIKATQVATLFHKAQVAFYGLMLEATLEEHGLAGVLDDEGQIWHRTPGSATWAVEPFNIRGYMRLIEDFFHQRGPRLGRIRADPHGVDETSFHIYFKCEQCKYLAHCRKSIEDSVPNEELDLSAVAGLTQQSKQSLQVLGVDTVGALLQSEGALHGVDDWGLRNNGWTLVRRARALVDQKIERLEGQYSLQMPETIDRPIYLLADRDPVDGRLATLGALAIGAEGEKRYHVRTIQSSNEEAEALQEVLGAVLQELAQVDAWNSEHSNDESLQTHIFTYEPADAADITEAMGRHLDRSEVRRGLLDLVRIFPPDEVVPEPDYRGFHYLPASSLRGVVTDVFALPLKVSHDLARVTQALATATSEFEGQYAPTEPFARPFSSRLSVDVCRRMGDPEVRQAVAADVRARLDAMHSLSTWLAEENGKQAASEKFLRLQKRPFRFRQRFKPIGATDLEILQAQSLLESHTARLRSLLELARPAAQRRARLNCYANLTLVCSRRDQRGNLFLLFDIPEASRQAELRPDEIGLILSDGDPDLLLAPEKWSGLFVDLRPPSGDVGPHQVELKVWSNTLEVGLLEPLLDKHGSGPWFVDRAHKDLNTEKVLGFLSYLGGV